MVASKYKKDLHKSFWTCQVLLRDTMHAERIHESRNLKQARLKRRSVDLLHEFRACYSLI